MSYFGGNGTPCPSRQGKAGQFFACTDYHRRIIVAPSDGWLVDPYASYVGLMMACSVASAGGGGGGGGCAATVEARHEDEAGSGTSFR